MDKEYNVNQHVWRDEDALYVDAYVCCDFIRMVLVCSVFALARSSVFGHLCVFRFSVACVVLPESLGGRGSGESFISSRRLHPVRFNSSNCLRTDLSALTGIPECTAQKLSWLPPSRIRHFLLLFIYFVLHLIIICYWFVFIFILHVGLFACFW